MSKSKVHLTLDIDASQAVEVLSHLVRLLKPAKFGVLFWATKEGVFVSDTITVKDSDPPVHARASFQDVEGATVDVRAAWAADDPNVAIVTTDTEDDQHVTIEPGSPGASLIHCVGTNEDGSTVELVGTFTVIPSDAVVGKIDFQSE